ncbi:MAG: ABC transporter ATP-binding protein [Halobacteriovoraceae bacterium]|nr:ABC transporter ATP-binding protein [Halobacteriovoraceae bacterium]
MAAIELIRVSKEFPGVKVIDNISFSVTKGRIHGLLGPNGAGKTTTMKIIAGLLPPSKGQVRVASSVGLLSENPPFYYNMTVERFLEFIAAIYGVEDKFIKKQVRSVMEKCGLSHKAAKPIGHLSKGFKQRVGIAQALVFDPEILIFDEPTVGLDPLAIDEIRALIRSLRGSHTILLSTHLLHEVDLLCSEMTIIHQGKILQTGEVGHIGKNLEARQVIQVELANWNEQIKNEMMKVFSFENMELQSRDGHMDLKFYFKDDRDLRPRLSEFFIKNNCGLLSFRRKNMNVEEIFRRITGGE